MSKHRSSYRWIGLVRQGGRPKVGTTRRGGDFFRGVAVGLLALALAGCGGSGGGTAAAGAGATPGGVATNTAALTASTALTTTITGVSINSPPVVNFTVTNQAGVGMAGLTAADLRFNIAKLV